MKLKELLNKLIEVQKKIGVLEPMICGGVPRDKVLNRIKKISDLDITNGTNTIDYLSQEFATELKKNYNIVRKTMPDGHSSIYLGSLKIDFSSNFVLPNINKLLFNIGINNPTDMQREIYSRDFTCNSLLLSLDLKKINDITKVALKDIKNKKIRTCLSPDITLVSNKNRVIRSIYLASKLDFSIDNSIIDFVKQHPESVKIASEKSLIEKLEESFNYDADKASFYLSKMNLWNHIPITDKVNPYYIKYKGKNV